MALVNQEAAANGQPPVGFLNPALYALGQSADYTNDFHDITVGNNATATSGGLFPAVPGYDLCTGWGSPKGSNLIHSLALPQRLVIAPNSALVFTGPVGGPLNPGALTYSLTRKWLLNPNLLARLEPGPGCRLADRLTHEWNAPRGRPGCGLSP